MQETITWEEAEWTREALGLSVADFARLIGVAQGAIYQGRRMPGSCLPEAACVLLRLAVNRLERDERGRWARYAA